MEGIIDRFEGKFVIVELEDRTMAQMDRKGFPLEAKEGDVIEIGENIVINNEKTEERKRKLEKLTKDLFI